MDKHLYAQLMGQGLRTPTIAASDFAGADRTLLYGYTLDRYTFHVYLKDGQIHRVVYDIHEDVQDYAAAVIWEADLLVPDKRAYPERTDGAFARLMLQRGFSVPYTRFDEELYETAKDKLFHGLIVE